VRVRRGRTRPEGTPQATKFDDYTMLENLPCAQQSERTGLDQN